MFQESIVLELVRSALGRRGHLITLRCSETAEQGLSLAASKAKGGGGNPEPSYR